MLGGALAMGVGVWFMLFIGMLALRLPFALGFDLDITVLRMMPASVTGGWFYGGHPAQTPDKHST